MKTSPAARKSDLVVQTTGNETLIYDLKTNKAFCLNDTSSAVWNLCDGRRSIPEIADEMSKKMKSFIDEDVICLALKQLNNDGLLASDRKSDERFTGLSRREIIRKVGFSSAVALPFVSSLVAPKALMAQSGIALLGQCFAPSGQQGNCNPGLTCFITNTVTTAGGSTPTGIINAVLLLRIH